MNTSPDVVLHLSHAGVSLVVDARDGSLPSVVHWGAQLGDLDDAALIGLVDAGVPVVGSNNVDTPPRIALLPEHHTGWTGRPGISGSADGRGWSPRFTTTAIEWDGAPVDGAVSAGAGCVVFHAVDDAGALSLQIDLELLASGLIRSRATLTNLQDDRFAVDEVSLAFPLPAEATEILDFTGQHNYERLPQRGPMRAGIHLRENRRGRTGADSAYVLHAGVPGFGFAAGRTWAVHTAWSGNHRHYAERVYTGEQVLGGGEVLLPGEMILARGESYETPWIYGAYGDGLDAIAHRFHDHLRALGADRPAERPVTLNVWEAVYFRHDAAELIALADQAAQIGIERFVLDDGWFGDRRTDRAGLGDWIVAKDVWPDGLHPLVDHVHAKGMQFGLWFEPEMINLDSDLARRHPEWIMAARDELPVESRAQHVLNLAAPGAYEHVKGQMLALLDEYRIDYIKWDHNRDLTEAGDRTRGGRPVVHEQTLAFYRLLRELKQAHPGLEIESCSSGGGRVDLGVLELTDRIWVSDNSDPHDRQSMMRWSAQLAPPSTWARISPRTARTRPDGVSICRSGRAPRSSATSASSGTSARRRMPSSSSWPDGSPSTKSIGRCCWAVTSCVSTPRIRASSSTAWSPRTTQRRSTRPRCSTRPTPSRRPASRCAAWTRTAPTGSPRCSSGRCRPGSSRRHGGAYRATLRRSRRRSTGTGPSAPTSATPERASAGTCWRSSASPHPACTPIRPSCTASSRWIDRQGPTGRAHAIGRDRSLPPDGCDPGRSALRVCYFTEPAVSPRTKNRCRAKKITSGTTRVMNDPAATRCQP